MEGPTSIADACELVFWDITIAQVSGGTVNGPAASLGLSTPRGFALDELCYVHAEPTSCGLAENLPLLPARSDFFLPRALDTGAALSASLTPLFSMFV